MVSLHEPLKPRQLDSECFGEAEERIWRDGKWVEARPPEGTEFTRPQRDRAGNPVLGGPVGWKELIEEIAEAPIRKSSVREWSPPRGLVQAGTRFDGVRGLT